MAILLEEKLKEQEAKGRVQNSVAETYRNSSMRLILWNSVSETTITLTRSSSVAQSYNTYNHTTLTIHTIHTIHTNHIISHNSYRSYSAFHTNDTLVSLENYTIIRSAICIKDTFIKL